MNSKHIAFCLEQAYGHLVPTLGITLELVRRGHRVSYAVTESFAPIVRQIHAHPRIIYPTDNRAEIISAVTRENDCQNYGVQEIEFNTVWSELSKERTVSSLSQLEYLYRDDKPDVIIHDDCFDTAGRALAAKWGIAKIRHHSQFLDDNSRFERVEHFSEDELILVTVPDFLQRNMAIFDRRFKFVGFIPEGRKEVFTPWKSRNRGTGLVLISPTTGLLPQRGFCQVAIEAFRGQPWEVVLSLSGSRDVISAINPMEFGDIPTNIELNRHSSNFDILDSSCLYIGQGGQGGALEAIFCGVPQIAVPPTPAHYSVASRVSELGLGDCLPIVELSTKTLIERVTAVLHDKEMLQRVRDCSSSMRNHRGAELAGDIVEAYLSGQRY